MGGPRPRHKRDLDDFGFPYQFTGFHKIEAALWWHDSLTGMNGVANQLKRNVDHIAFLIQPTTYQPAEIQTTRSSC